MESELFFARSHMRGGKSGGGIAGDKGRDNDRKKRHMNL